MKVLISIVIGLLVVGCLTPEQKQKNVLRSSVAGEYEYRNEVGYTVKHVYLENGRRVFYINGKKYLRYTGAGDKWSIVDEEINVKDDDSGLIAVFRINTDKSITYIASFIPDKRGVCMQILGEDGIEYIRHGKGCKDSWREHALTKSQRKQFSEYGEPERKYFKDGKRTDVTKVEQITFRRIK